MTKKARLAKLEGLFSSVSQKLSRLHELDSKYADHPSEAVQRELLINRGLITANNQELTRLSRLIIEVQEETDLIEPLGPTA